MNKKLVGAIVFFLSVFFIGTTDVKAAECIYRVDTNIIFNVSKTGEGINSIIDNGTKRESLDTKDLDANKFFKENNTLICPTIYWVRKEGGFFTKAKNYVSTSPKDTYKKVEPLLTNPEGSNGTVTKKICTYERTLNTGFSSSNEDISAKRKIVLRYDTDNFIRVEASGTNYNNPPNIEGDFKILNGRDTCSWTQPENCTFNGYIEDTTSYDAIEGCPRLCIDTETKEYFFIPLEDEACTDRRNSQSMNEDPNNSLSDNADCKELTKENKNKIQDKIDNIEYDSDNLGVIVNSYDYKFYNAADVNSMKIKSSEILASLEILNSELERVCEGENAVLLKEYQNQIRVLTQKVKQLLIDIKELLKKSHEYFVQTGDNDTADKIAGILEELGVTSDSINEQVKKVSLLSKLEFGDDIGEASCESILGDLVDELQKYFDWIKILAPILLMVFGGLDFAKAVIASDKDALQKATSKFVKRCIAALAIFFLPTLIELLFSMTDLSIEDAVCGIL